MNTYFVNTPDGIIKTSVQYNPLWTKYQVIIDGTVYGQFETEKEAEAIEYLKNSFLEENFIVPDCTLLISDESPLSNQVKKITGDNYNISDFEDLYKSTLIKHRKSGLIIRTISKREIKEQLEK